VHRQDHRLSKKPMDCKKRWTNAAGLMENEKKENSDAGKKGAEKKGRREAERQVAHPEIGPSGGVKDTGKNRKGKKKRPCRGDMSPGGKVFSRGGRRGRLVTKGGRSTNWGGKTRK